MINWAAEKKNSFPLALLVAKLNSIFDDSQHQETQHFLNVHYLKTDLLVTSPVRTHEWAWAVNAPKKSTSKDTSLKSHHQSCPFIPGHLPHLLSVIIRKWWMLGGENPHRLIFISPCTVAECCSRNSLLTSFFETLEQSIALVVIRWIFNTLPLIES